MSDLKGSKVLITGGASGIGKRMAEEMDKQGAHVIVWDIEEGRFDNPGSISSYRCDLSDKNEIMETAERVQQEIGHPDILINNAGVVSGKTFMECEDQKIEQTVKVNILAYLWTVRAFLPAMLERNSGHIVTISSAAGLIGVSSLADYSASKFAVFGFDESLRNEFKNHKRNIKTTVVCPYYINTGMFEGVKTRFSFLLPILDQEKVVKKILKAIRKNKARLYMPWIVYTVPLLRTLPVSWFDTISTLLGVNATMDEFVGRQK